MAQDNLNELRNKLDKKIKIQIANHANTILDKDITISNENFERLKKEIHIVINKLESDYDYKISYYMKPTHPHTITDYVVTIIIQKDYELVAQYDINRNIRIESVSEINYEDVRKLTFFEFLTESNKQHELEHFFEALADYEADCIMEGDWMSTLHNYGLGEWEYFDSLNDIEKEVFAKAQGYTYAKNIVHKPIDYLTMVYNLDLINTFFDKIKFVEK